MGKTNKANRTKGNTRPSSSEHSAQLLNLSGKPLSGFIGFGGLEKDIPGYVPVTGQPSDVVDLSVDSDLRMVMRKMMKKDSVTRLKAVQEFGDLCSAKETDSLKNVLPFWPRLFNKLALDYDRRIREATHQANGKLISKVKREVAPYLKNIMGVWLLGQSDLHAPAASAAQAIFTETFPQPKQSEALMYCKNEIFALFKDNLFEQTSKSMSENSSATTEDIENKYTLVISATFQAMKFLLVTVTAADLLSIQDDLTVLVTDNKFWKFAKSKEPQIRGSWYMLVSSLCQMKPDIFAETEKKLAAAVFGSLAESDPTVAPPVWECALHTVVNFTNCFQGINIHKVVLPQLWLLLNDGGKGNAHVLYPCILPFLSKFPKEVICKDTFLLQFFTCLKNSLTIERVKSSSMECDAILITFVECLQYMSFISLEDVKEKTTLLEKILCEQATSLVESSFYDNKYLHLATSRFYPLLGSFIQKLEGKVISEPEEVSKHFSEVLTLFWNNIYNLFLKVFDKAAHEKEKIAIYITYFFNSMFQSSPIVPKSDKGKVRFQVEDDEEEEKSEPETLPLCPLAEEMYNKMPISFKNAIRFITTLCNKNDEDIQDCYLRILDELLSSTLTSQFLKDILKSYEESNDSSNKASLTFFDKIILKWLSKVVDESSLNTIVAIVFVMCGAVSEEEALELLNLCCEVGHPMFLMCLLNTAIGMHAQSPIAVIERWLKGDVLSDCIMNGLRELIRSLKCGNEVECGDFTTVLTYRDVFVNCIRNSELQETFEKKKYIEGIITMCEDLLVSGLRCEKRDVIIQTTCSIIKIILENCQACWNYKVTHHVVYWYYHWNFTAGEHAVKEESCKLLEDVWKAAIFSAFKFRIRIICDESFILNAAKEMNLSLTNLSTVEQATKTTLAILDLLHSVEEVEVADSYSTDFVLCEVLDVILPSSSDWDNLMKNLAFSFYTPMLKGRIFYPLPEEKKVTVSAEDVLRLSMAVTVISDVFLNEYESHANNKDEPYFQQYVQKHLPYILWSFSYLNGNGILNEKVTFKIQKLEDDVMKLTSLIPYDSLINILKDIFKNALVTGSKWIFPLNLTVQLVKHIYPESETSICELLPDAYQVKSDQSSMVIQLLSQHIPTEKKIVYLKYLLEGLLKQEDGCKRVIDNAFLQNLALVCCFIQDVEVLTEEIEDMLVSFLNNLVTYCSGMEDNVLFRLQVCALWHSLIYDALPKINKSAWDNFLIILRASLEEGENMKFNKPRDMLLMFQISNLYSFIHTFQPTASVTELPWKPTVPEELHEKFITFFAHVGGSIKKYKQLPIPCKISLSRFMKACAVIPSDIACKYLMQPVKVDENIVGSKSLANKVSNPLDNFYSMMLSDVEHLQWSVHLLLIRTMPILAECLLRTCKNDSDDSNEEEEGKIPSLLQPLVDILILQTELMESLLEGDKIGDGCVVQPFTEPYGFVSAYMFAWLHMLEFIASSPSQKRCGYVTQLQELNLLSPFFTNVCCLIPMDPMISGTHDSPYVLSPKKKAIFSMFMHSPTPTADNPKQEDMQNIACYTLCNAMQKVPASVRTWWNNLDKNSADLVNRFTVKYISCFLSTVEIESVEANENIFQNMQVKARFNSREVIAIYTVDDYTIELSVALPYNYPLGPIMAEKRGKIVLQLQEWRQWLMQLTTVLNYQNGSILDGLTIWKRNLDKKFEGVEECMICYYVLHNSTLKLPKLSCHVCRKKFHSACLYKWFHSSNNFTCPLCRNEFLI